MTTLSYISEEGSCDQNDMPLTRLSKHSNREEDVPFTFFYFNFNYKIRNMRFRRYSFMTDQI